VAWSWPFTFFQCRGKEWVEIYLHPPSRFMARYLVMHRNNFTFTLIPLSYSKTVSHSTPLSSLRRFPNFL